MSNIVMPDFQAWCKALLYGKSDYRIEEALKQAFDQGYRLGFREGADIDEWFEEQDNDKEWLESHDQPTEE